MNYGLNIAKTSIMSFLKINAIGLISTLIFGFSAFSLITNDFFQIAKSFGHGTIWTYIIGMITIRPVGVILAILVTILSPILAFTLGNKYILNKISKNVLTDKSQNFINPIIDKAFLKIEKTNPSLLSKGTDAIKLKLKLIDEIKNSDDKKWLKRITLIGLRKLKLEEESFSSETFTIKETISNKILSTIAGFPKPSRKFIYIIISVQILVYILLRTKAI